jgi:GT2 family glycosyltransferase
MSKLVEYVNPHPYTVQISGPHREIIRVNKYSKVVLSDWFIDRYTPKFLRVVRILGADASQMPGLPASNSPPQSQNVTLLGKKKPQRSASVKRSPRVAGFGGVRSGRAGGRVRRRRRDRIVGKALAHASEVYNQAIQEVSVAISNNIGVGILSYNRLGSLQRLINSIRKYTDLSRTTVIVSDDGSSDSSVKEWLSHQHDIIVLNNQHRAGISGNSNRLLRCLDRFKYKILLNDDVEIINSGWDLYYFDAMINTGYHHFCFRQPGLYGAGQKDGKQTTVNAYTVNTVQEKPHGAVMAFDHEAFTKVGYFDEHLDSYGMEHVDWSNRVTLAKLQPAGFHDIAGAARYFKIHREKSAFVQKGRFLRENRAKYENFKGNKTRVYVNATERSAVPTITTIMPIRDIGRSDSIRTVLNSLRAQRFPAIEMILVEQDGEKKFHLAQAEPIKYLFVASTKPNQDFNKARAFNHAVLTATSNKIILHDADIMVQADYIKRVADILEDFEGCHIGETVSYLDPSSTAQLCHSNRLDKTYKCERAVGYFEGGSVAFRKPIYFKIGGFNEAYEGYGVEDCDFFERLKSNSHFFNQRSIDMFHLWHSRVPGWNDRHKANKRLAETITRTMSGHNYVQHLITQMQAKYPQSKKYYV